MEAITIRKLDHAGRQVTAYTGEVLRRENSAIVLYASWEHPPLDLGFAVFETGSRWIEHFYADRLALIPTGATVRLPVGRGSVPLEA
jgi:hypothetical protein